jgi:hypothetical protein
MSDRLIILKSSWFSKMKATLPTDETKIIGFGEQQLVIVYHN